MKEKNERRNQTEINEIVKGKSDGNNRNRKR